MLYVFVYWIFATLSFLGSGSLISLLKPNKVALLHSMGYGVFVQTLLFSILCFFIPLNHFAIQLFLGLSVLWGTYIGINFLIKNKNFIFKQHYLLFLFVIIGVAFQSSHIPSFPDHDSYYIPTVRWLQEFGYVKGLANWHYFLGQCSAWHVLFAAHDSLLPFQTFGLNSWLLLWGAFYLGNQDTNEPKKSIFLGIYVVLAWVFIDGISPDMTVYVVIYIVFYEIQRKKNISFFGGLLLIWVVFVKVIYAPVLLLLLLYKNDKKKLWVILFLVCLIVSAKNYILTGHLGYPIPLSLGYTPDWAMPAELFSLLKNQSNGLLFYLMNSGQLKLHFLEATAWLFVIGSLTFFGFRTREINLKYLIFVLLIHTLTMGLFSIQFRFIYFIVPIMLVLWINYLHFKINIAPSIKISIISLILLFMSTYQVIPQIKPRKIIVNQWLIAQKREYHYKKVAHNNLVFYIPESPRFFYEIGDLPLPSNSGYWLQHLEKKFNLHPVLRDNEIKNGFRMEKKVMVDF